MSLVNDALKKARLEAARQDAARRGLPMPGAQLAGRSGPSSRVLARVGALAAVVVLALLVFLAGRRFGSVEPPREAPVEAGVTAAVDPVAAPGVETVESDHAESPAPAEPLPVTAPQPVPPPREPEPRVDAGATRSPRRSEPAAAPEAPSPAAEESAPVAGTSSLAAGPSDRTARRRRDPEPRVRIVSPNASSPAAGAEPPLSVARVLELPGAIRIELGGIAWSEQRPFALVNGRVVGPGDVVESLTVVAIAQRHVELEGEAGHFLLKLK